MSAVRPPAGYAIRPYEAADAADLAAAEARASALFAVHGYPSLSGPPMEPARAHAFAAAHETLVAVHRLGLAGYAVCHELAGFLHLRELGVDPAHGRRGLGAALLHAVIDRSCARRLAGVSLSTFRALPFNAPFYARHGFVECPLEDAPSPLARQFRAEVPPGVDAATRLLMLRPNPPRG